MTYYGIVFSLGTFGHNFHEQFLILSVVELVAVLLKGLKIFFTT